MTFAAIFKRLETRRPPSLTAILDAFDNAEYLTAFVDLVHRFLPKREEDIMSQVSAINRCIEFVRLFSAQYHVELAEYDFSDEPYQLLLWGIPIALEGLNYSEYDEFANNYSPEWVCMERWRTEALLVASSDSTTGISPYSPWRHRMT